MTKFKTRNDVYSDLQLITGLNDVLQVILYYYATLPGLPILRHAISSVRVH